MTYQAFQDKRIQNSIKSPTKPVNREIRIMGQESNHPSPASRTDSRIKTDFDKISWWTPSSGLISWLVIGALVSRGQKQCLMNIFHVLESQLNSCGCRLLWLLKDKTILWFPNTLKQENHNLNELRTIRMLFKRVQQFSPMSLNVNSPKHWISKSTGRT